MLQSFDDRGFSHRVKQRMPGANRVQLRPMFGGYGFFEHNTMFAIAVNDQLYLRVDADTQPEFERRGLERFHYDQKDQTLTLDFYHAPAEVFREEKDMQRWVNRARKAAFRRRSRAA